MEMIELKGVGLVIDKKDILKDISFKVKKGDKIALLGPNGAGKSSLIDLITNILKPTKGEIKVAGGSFDNYRSKVGILYEYVPLFHEMKVWEVIRYISIIKNADRERVTHVADKLGLSDHYKKQLHVLSKGQKKKLGILLTIMSEPELVILDEPTSDLDPMIRDLIWKEIGTLSESTLLFTTHLWEETSMSDRILFINDGEILAEDTYNDFLSTQYIHSESKVVLGMKEVSEDLLKGESYYSNEDQYVVFPSDLDQFLEKTKKVTFNITILEKELKDVYSYLAYTKKHKANATIL